MNCWWQELSCDIRDFQCRFNLQIYCKRRYIDPMTPQSTSNDMSGGRDRNPRRLHQRILVGSSVRFSDARWKRRRCDHPPTRFVISTEPSIVLPRPAMACRKPGSTTSRTYFSTTLTHGPRHAFRPVYFPATYFCCELASCRSQPTTVPETSWHSLGDIAFMCNAALLRYI